MKAICNNNHSDRIIFQDTIMDTNRFEVTVNETPIYLTLTEFKLLEYLILNSERAVSREELLKEIWSIPESIETRATDDMVKRLRKKLKSVNAKTAISTVRGYGFMISKQPSKSKPITFKKDHAPAFIQDIIKQFPIDEQNSVTIKIKSINNNFEISFL